MLNYHTNQIFQVLIDKLRSNSKTKLQKLRRYYMLRCPSPSHGPDGYDEHPSLRLSFNKKHGLKLKCYTGCSEEEICKGLIERYEIPPELLKRLFGKPVKQEKGKGEEEIPGCSLKELLAPIPEDVIELVYDLLAHDLKVREELFEDNSKSIVVFLLQDPEGKDHFFYRLAVEGKNKNRLAPGAPARKLLFIPKLKNFKFVIFTESPLDALVLILIFWPNCLAIAGVGKNNTVSAVEHHREKLIDLIRGKEIYVWVEPDAKDFARNIAKVLRRDVKEIEGWPELKDAWRMVKHLGFNKAKETIKELIWQAKEIKPFEVKIKTFAELAEEAPSSEWLIEGWVNKGELWLILGRPGIGKTTLALSFLKAFKSGEELFGRAFKKVDRLLYIYYEKISSAIETAEELEISDIKTLNGGEGGVNIQNLDLLEYLIEREGIEVIVIDPLIYFLGLKKQEDLNDYAKLSQMLAPLKELIAKYKVTIFALHHTRKPIHRKQPASEVDALGSTALSAVADGKFILTKEKGKLMIKVEGNKIPEESVSFNWNAKVPVVSENESKPEEAAKIIIEYLKNHPKLTYSEILRYITQKIPDNLKPEGYKSLVKRALSRLETKGIIKKEKQGVNTYYSLISSEIS